MKLMKVVMDTKTHWGVDNQAELDRAATCTLNDYMSALVGAVKEPGYYPTWIMADHVLLQLIQDVGIGEISSEGNRREFWVKGVELFMDVGDPLGSMQKMAERMELAASRLTAMPGCGSIHDTGCDHHNMDAGWNHKTESPISGPHLHHMNRLMLAEECCTDALQRHLDDGWRLVAVCPQEARRPDYVLGRIDAQKFGEADRG